MVDDGLQGSSLRLCDVTRGVYFEGGEEVGGVEEVTRRVTHRLICHHRTLP